MKQNLLLPTLQYIQSFTKKELSIINIEKHLDNVYRFVATDGSVLSYIDIDFTPKHYQDNNELLILEKLLKDKTEIVIDCNKVYFKKYITALKNNLNFDFEISERVFPKYKSLIETTKENTQHYKSTRFYNSSSLYKMTDAIRKLPFLDMQIEFEILKLRDTTNCLFNIKEGHYNSNSALKECKVIIAVVFSN